MKFLCDEMLKGLGRWLRVAGYDTVMPLPKLEAAYLPSVGRIVSAARRVLAQG